MQITFDLDQHVLCRFLNQRLGGENMFDFGRADAKGQCAECTVGRGVRVAANHRHTGKGEAFFGAYNMDNTLTQVRHREVMNTGVGSIFIKGFNLNAAVFFLDAFGAIRRRNVVIGHGKGQFRMAHFATGIAKAFKGLRAGHFMDKMTVNINQAGSIILRVDHMAFPNLVKKGFRRTHLDLLLKSISYAATIRLWCADRTLNRGFRPNDTRGVQCGLARLVACSSGHPGLSRRAKYYYPEPRGFDRFCRGSAFIHLGP